MIRNIKGVISWNSNMYPITSNIWPHVIWKYPARYCSVTTIIITMIVIVNVFDQLSPATSKHEGGEEHDGDPKHHWKVVPLKNIRKTNLLNVNHFTAMPHICLFLYIQNLFPHKSVQKSWQNWVNFRFLPICHVEIAKISQRDRFFLHRSHR